MGTCSHTSQTPTVPAACRADTVSQLLLSRSLACYTSDFWCLRFDSDHCPLHLHPCQTSGIHSGNTLGSPSISLKTLLSTWEERRSDAHPFLLWGGWRGWKFIHHTLQLSLRQSPSPNMPRSLPSGKYFCNLSLSESFKSHLISFQTPALKFFQYTLLWN